MRRGARERNNLNKRKKKVQNKKILVIAIIILIIALIGLAYGLNKTHQTENESEQEIDKKVEESNEENIEENQETEETQKPQEKEEIKYSMTKGNKFVKIDNTIAYIDSINGNNLYIFNIEENSAIQVNTPRELWKIYFDGENIYGVPNHYSGKGIYKIDLQGKVTQIYEGESAQLWLTEDKIYFVKQNGFDEINQTPQGDLCSMDKDGNNITTIIPNVKNYFNILGNKIYYTDGETRDLYVADINGENKEELAQGRTLIAGINEKYIVYVDYEDGEKYHVVYLDDKTNHEVGRFGSCYVTENEGYILTRKLVDENNNIENEFSVFKIDSNNKEEKQMLKNDMVLPYLAYVYQNKAYIEEQDVIRADLENGNIEENMPNGYYLDGYCYELRMTDNRINEIGIYNLETMEEQKIALTYFLSDN